MATAATHCLDGPKGPTTAIQRGIGLVGDSRQVLAFLALALEVAQRTAARIQTPPPTGGSARRAPIRGVEPQKEALGVGRLYFYDQKLEGRPVGRQIWIQVIQRPLVSETGSQIRVDTYSVGISLGSSVESNTTCLISAPASPVAVSKKKEC